MANNEMLTFLASVDDAHARYIRKKSWAEEQFRRCGNITANWESLPGGSGDPHKDAALIAYSQACAETRMWKKEWERREKEVEKFLDRIPDKVHRLVLQLRFVDMLTWPQVAERMKDYDVYYVDRHLKRFQDPAIAAAQELWEADHKKKENE